MRITHVISNLGLGGAEGALCALVETMRDVSTHHTVISMLPNGAYSPRLRAAGANVIELEGRRSIAFALRSIELGRAIRASRPDIVQGWMYHANLAVSLLALGQAFRAPVIWGVRQSVSRLSDDVPLTRAVIRAGRLLSFQPRRIIYNSASGAETHEELGYPRAKRVIVLNGVDTARFRPRSEARAKLLGQLGLPADAVIVGRVARFAPMKDFGTLLKAYSLLRSELPAAHLVLVGPGIETSNATLQELWVAAGAPEGVHFCVPRQDVENVYPAFDVAVSSSSSNEGFANAVFEALASGTPVIATDVGTADEYREAGAIVIPPMNAAAMAQTIRAVLDRSPQEQAAAAIAARDAIGRCFSLEACAAGFRDVWSQSYG